MANALGVDVGECPEQLIDVQLDFENWHGRLHLVEEARGSVDRLRHELLNEVEIHFILLLKSLADLFNYVKSNGWYNPFLPTSTTLPGVGGAGPSPHCFVCGQDELTRSPLE